MFILVYIVMHIKSYIIDQICILFATSSLDHSKAQNDQGRHVKQELEQKKGDETAPFWIA